MAKVLILLLLFTSKTFAQVLLENTHVRVSMGDGSFYDLFATRDCATCYYYLPQDLNVSKKANGDHEISLVTWKNDDESEISGGIFHFLVQWGPSAQQEKRLLKELKTHDSLGVVLGCAGISINSMTLNGEDSFSEILKSSLTNELMAPSTPGAKVALSFRVSEEKIHEFIKYVQNPGKIQGKLIMAYQYEVLSSTGMQQVKKAELSLPFKDIFKLLKR